jgi:hypothetical protein
MGDGESFPGPMAKCSYGGAELRGSYAILSPSTVRLRSLRRFIAECDARSDKKEGRMDLGWGLLDDV